MSSESIAVLIPYFGELPNYFPIFLKSCETNGSIDWILFTDVCKNYDYPKNVHIVRMEFSILQRMVQDKFDFEVSLSSPYKLCDYRPAFGYIFEEYISEYDFWGYGDVDLIYGDIRKYLTDDVMKCEKVFDRGHFSLVRNSYENNRMFMESNRYKDYYKQVFQSEKAFNFDESFLDKVNINMFFTEKGKLVCDRRFMADIYTKSSDFCLDNGDGKKENKRSAFFLWDNGRLFRYTSINSRIERSEYMYIHLQKRKMKVAINEDEMIIKIIPNCFEPLEFDIGDIEKKFGRIKKKHFNLHYFRLRFKNLLVKLKGRI